MLPAHCTEIVAQIICYFRSSPQQETSSTKHHKKEKSNKKRESVKALVLFYDYFDRFKMDSGSGQDYCKKLRINANENEIIIETVGSKN